MLSKLNRQKEDTNRRKSLRIKEKLFRLKAFKQAKTVMFYLASSSEVQTRRMIEEALAEGKRLVVPVCRMSRKKIIPCLITSLEAKYFKKGPYLIDEPIQKRPIKPDEIDVCVVPALAFDRQGNRLGRGAGYYDRFLGGLPKAVFKVGLAFKFQVFKRLSCCLPHDIRVDKVLFA